jgi:hypothetical protein
MGSLYLIDPATAPWWLIGLFFVWFFAWTIGAYSFMDWFNDYALLKAAFPNGNAPQLKSWRELFTRKTSNS